MSGMVDKILGALARSGLRRGFGDGGWAWLVLAGAAFLLRRARRPEESSTRIELHPGERYVLRALAPGSDQHTE